MCKTLGNMASLIRSKNAGPFVLTFDIMFDNMDNYKQVLNSGIINKPLISQMFNVSEEDILIIWCDQAQGIKISIPRPRSGGGLRESDGHGGQQFGPFVNLKVPGV